MFCRTTRCPPNCLPRPEGPDPPLPGAGPGPATLSQGTPAPPRVPGGPGAQHLAGPTVETTLKAEILSYFYMMRTVFTFTFYQCCNYAGRAYTPILSYKLYINIVQSRYCTVYFKIFITTKLSLWFALFNVEVSTTLTNKSKDKLYLIGRNLPFMTDDFVLNILLIEIDLEFMIFNERLEFSNLYFLILFI